MWGVIFISVLFSIKSVTDLIIERKRFKDRILMLAMLTDLTRREHDGQKP